MSSTFLGLAGFYMSAVFYSLGLLIDIVCASESTSSSHSAVPLSQAYLCNLRAVCILARVLRISRESEGNHALARRSTQAQVWRVVEALVQSTAITCAASMSLVVTFVNSASLGYPTCLNIFPALIVRPSFGRQSTTPFHIHLAPHLLCALFPSSPPSASAGADPCPPPQALVFSLTVLRIALNARASDGRPGADSGSGLSHVASDQRAIMMGSTTVGTASCGMLAESPTRIHISTTTIVQHDLDFDLEVLPKPPGLGDEDQGQGGGGGEFVLPLPV